MWKPAINALLVYKKYKGELRLLGTYPYSHVPATGVWYTLKARLDGDVLRFGVSLPGSETEPAFVVYDFSVDPDRHAFLAGKAGLYARSTDVMFDNVASLETEGLARTLMSFSRHRW